MKTSAKTGGPEVAYLLCGAAIGAALGVLFAPKKGSELRADIGDFGRSAGEKGRELYGRAKDMIPSRDDVAGVIASAKRTGHGALRHLGA